MLVKHIPCNFPSVFVYNTRYKYYDLTIYSVSQQEMSLE